MRRAEDSLSAAEGDIIELQYCQRRVHCSQATKGRVLHETVADYSL
jgi:hypothetical protein